MSRSNSPQIARIELANGADAPIVHCPICGNPTLKMINDQGQVNPCDHLVFILDCDLAEFEYKSPEFDQKLAATFNWRVISLEKVEKSLKKLGYNNELLVLEITFGGVACGPYSFTDLVAFDYSKV